MIIDTKFKSGRYMVPVKLCFEDDYIYISFGYNKALIAEIKVMQGARWLGFEEPPRKVWRIPASPRNLFQIRYLRGLNPYKIYDKDIIKHDYNRPLYSHQKELADFFLTRKRGIGAAEMGTGKSLAAIEVMERSGFHNWWYIGPKSAIKAVEYELMKWDSKICPIMYSYNKLVNIMKSDSIDLPQGVWLDESSRVKSPTSQRSQAALLLADKMRETFKDDCYVILTSGTPAPKSPLDWYHQAEIACPGFLKEGTYSKFRSSLAIIAQQESPFGQAYPKIVSWLDDSNKCAICGRFKDEHISITDHSFTPSINECERLYKRLSGLVLVQFKKDCLELPEKIYRRIELKPSKKTLDMAKAIVANANTVIKGLILLRELSDGFQYIESESGTKVCPICLGTGEIDNPLIGMDIPEDSMPKDSNLLPQDSKIICDGCGGTGKIKTYARTTQQIETPKDQALRDLLDEYSEVGRVVIYGGFTGSIDRCVQICQDEKWEFIRADGRGWHSSIEGDPIVNFQDKLSEHPRVAFIGQPGAAGMGLTLTASPVVIYYSNDFNGESRQQSEDRIHRPGADTNRGCTIIDLLHLETDYLILENLKKKKKLQALTMGDVTKALEGNCERHT